MSPQQLQRARVLDLPEREAMLRREPSVQQFWTENRGLLIDAWTDWDDEIPRPASLDDTLLDHDLRTAVSGAWNDPTNEGVVRDLLREVAPDVFAFQFFDPQRLETLRRYLETAWDSGIPIRPPYGIVLNRGGAMLDPRSDGYLAAPSFQRFYRQLLDVYMRPIARLLFPEVVGYDTQTFGFSINYQPNTDTSIRPHSDASAATLNINLNLPGEDFSGSAVHFFGSHSGDVRTLSFEPGMAIIHRGSVPHAAQPIVTGERTNMVLWLFGAGGRVPGAGSVSSAIGEAERWKEITEPQDDYAPF